jgi:transglutaminase-like putative cysteine protease
MIARILRRVPFLSLVQPSLLLIAVYSFVAGLGSIVRGAETSAFLPAGILAALLGWGLGQSRLKGWQSALSLVLIGGILLWGRTAQFGGPLLLLAISVLINLWQYHFYKLGGPAPNLAPIQTAVESMVSQSAAVASRMQAWIVSLNQGANVDDPVVRVLFWSILLWAVVAWAGWACGRNKVLAGLAPALGVLAAITKYTGANVAMLWLMAVSMLFLLGITRFDANLRRWSATQLDYAELIIPNTMFALVFVNLALGALGWGLPMISVKDILESFRRHGTAQNQTARSLGLEPPTQSPTRPISPFAPLRSSNLPNKHLLGSGPELSKDIVFTVHTGELPPIPVSNVQIQAPRHYWRSNTFDGYNGLGWFSAPAESIQYSPEQALYEVPPGYKVLTQKFDLRRGDKGSLYWTGSLYRSDTPFEAAWRIPPGQNYPQAVDPFRGADLLGALNASSSYQVESLIPQLSVETLRSAGRDYPNFIEKRYTALPENLPERVYALARELTSTSATPYDEAKAIEGYLRKNYPYSLDVPMPPPDQDVADYFLFDLKTGYCDYYATAMAVLARSVGIPARLVMGYANGTYNPSTAEYVVTAADAHAWVEIYFPGSGWVEFEPTSNRLELLPPAQGAKPTQVKFTPAQQWDKILRTVYRLPSVARWVFFGVAGVLILFLLFFLLEGWLLGLAAPAFALRWIQRSVYRQGTRLIGAAPVPGQTASEFTENLQSKLETPDPRLDLLTKTFLKSLFSPNPLKKDEIRAAIRAWRGLRWKLLWVRGGRRKK